MSNEQVTPTRVLIVPTKEVLRAILQLKKGGNNYDKVREWLQASLNSAYGDLVALDDPKLIYRRQGAIAALSSFIYSFDNVETVLAGAIVSQKESEAAEELLK